MYPKAVEAGIPADKYWSMTYDEIIVQAEANVKIKQRNLEEQAMLNYKSAQLNAYGFNSPEKMPRFEEVYPFVKINTRPSAGKISEDTQQQDWQIMKARMEERAALIKQTRARKNVREEG